MTIIDYAYPCMMAERALKKAHDAMLLNRYDEAVEQSLVAIAETKLMITSIKEMKEKANGLRKQTPPVQEGIPAAVGSRGIGKTNGAATSKARH